MINEGGAATRGRRLLADLAALAEEERAQFGEPPTAEQLIADHSNRFELIRDRLAVDPHWAAIYFDLKRAHDLESLSAEVPGGAITDAEVDDGWRELAAKLDQGLPSNSAPEQDARETPPLTLELSQELERKLSAEAERHGIPLEEHALRRLDEAPISADSSLETGAELVAYWQSEGVIGSRPDIEDSQAHARKVRRRVERRTLS